MKNILFGLMAITSVAFAGLPNLGADVSTAPSGAVFQTGQSGEITVTGKLRKNPEIIKYVVFASTDESYTGGADQEIYTLPTFTIAGSNSSTTPGWGFDGATLPKVYVKKVNSANSGVEDLTNGEVVSFKVNIDPEWLAAGVTSEIFRNFVSNATNFKPTIFVLLAKAELDPFIASGAELTVFSSGSIRLEDSSRNTYNPGYIYFKVFGDGTAGFEEDSFVINNTAFSPTILKQIETAFATPKTGYADLSISVKVN